MKNKTNKGFRARMADRKLEWFVFFLMMALAVAVAWPLCTMTVEAGHVGVYFSRFFGGTVVNKAYNEGLHFLLPWDAIVQYDKRLQSKDYNVTALTKGGLRVNVDMAVLWHVKPEQAGFLHTSAGPDYRVRVIDPAVMSTVRSVIGSCEQNQLYDGNPLLLQDDVMNLLGETLVNTPFTIHSILIREVKLPDQMTSAISQKFVAEQNVLAARYRVLESIETYKKSYVDAEGVRLSQSIVSEGMSEAYLRYLGINATQELAKSNNAKLVIIGDKDGMPLILNPGTMDVSMTLPEGLKPEDYIPQGQEGARRNELAGTFDRMQGLLGLMDNLLGELASKFPEAEESMSYVDLQQANQVPPATSLPQTSR